jgi:hypothetical protein
MVLIFGRCDGGILPNAANNIGFYTDIDRLVEPQLHSLLTMRSSKFTLLRLLLVLALVLSPLQHAFAMQASMQCEQHDGSIASMLDEAAQPVSANPVDDVDASCQHHSQNSSCKSCNTCGGCSLTLGVERISARHHTLATGPLSLFSRNALYQTDLLPDFRPPRHA